MTGLDLALSVIRRHPRPDGTSGPDAALVVGVVLLVVAAVLAAVAWRAWASSRGPAGALPDPPLTDDRYDATDVRGFVESDGDVHVGVTRTFSNTRGVSLSFAPGQGPVPALVWRVSAGVAAALGLIGVVLVVVGLVALVG